MSWRWVRGVVVFVAMGGVAHAVAQEARPMPMPKEAHPVMDVATIHRTDPASTDRQIGTTGERVKLRGQTVTWLMIYAYGVHADQVIGGPGWRSEERYDVDGRMDIPGFPDREQLQEILVKMLEDRFGLKVHHEKRDMRYYAVTLTKGAPALAKAPEGENSGASGGSNSGVYNVKFTNFTMEDFALAMDSRVDHRMVDETGLAGRYDFTLKWTRDDAPTTETDGPPGLFTAIQEQLGLKIEAKRGMVDVLVIDGVTRPSEN